MNSAFSPVSFAAKHTFFYKDRPNIESESKNRAENLFALHKVLDFAKPETLSEDAFVPSGNMSKMGKECTNLTEIGQNKDTGAAEITRTVTLKDDYVLGRISVLSADDFKSDSDKGLFKSAVKYLEACKDQVLSGGNQIVASESLKEQYSDLMKSIETVFNKVVSK